jgi:hypothetical protein
LFYQSVVLIFYLQIDLTIWNLPCNWRHLQGQNNSFSLPFFM